MTKPNLIDKQTMVMDIRQLVPLDEAKSYWLCLNENTWLLVQMLHSFYGSWRNRYSQNTDVETPIQPDDEQWNLVMDIFDRGEMELTQVTCLDDLIEAINGITAQISLSQTSGNCGCVASGDQDVTTIGDNPSSDIPQGEEVPPGFEDKPEYDSYRCKAATYIFDNYVATLRNWAGLAGMTGGLTLAVIVGLCLLTVPPVGLTIILAALGTLVGVNIGLLAELNNIANGLDDNRTEAICALYNAETTQDAVDGLGNLADSVIDGLSLTLPATYKIITRNLISNEQMEVLFTKDAAIDALDPGDCSTCVGGIFQTLTYNGCTPAHTFGNFQPGVSTKVESCTTSIYGDTRANNLMTTTVPGVNRRVEVTAYTGGSNGLYLDWYDEGVHQTSIAFDPGSSIVGEVFECTSLHFSRLAVDDTTPYTLTFTVTEL